ncbi:hypothetical protein HOLleu_17697 [Holothuria leucospilota]|uniref:CCHC-type domain-containing protein n=1 Tax=Holothuria leucospilota TaxID=206669 RepID=A0A9Q1C2E7_HOLLE|nr:hypothetical protein HOLleu_17697 [Holothuria leucospilota]
MSEHSRESIQMDRSSPVSTSAESWVDILQRHTTDGDLDRQREGAVSSQAGGDIRVPSTTRQRLDSTEPLISFDSGGRQRSTQRTEYEVLSTTETDGPRRAAVLGSYEQLLAGNPTWKDDDTREQPLQSSQRLGVKPELRNEIGGHPPPVNSWLDEMMKGRNYEYRGRSGMNTREQTNPFSKFLPIETKYPEKCEAPGNRGRPNVLPPPFDGTGNWDDYMVQFELIAELNAWDQVQKALYLAASLKGQARAILSDLDSTHRRDYSQLSAALSNRFSPANQTQLFRAMLKNRARKPDESIPQLAIETLARDYFIDSLGDTDTKWRVYQSRPRNLSDAVVVAVELESFFLAETKKGNLRRPIARAVVPPANDGDKVEKQMKFLGEALETLTSNFEKMQTQILKQETQLRDMRETKQKSTSPQLDEKRGNHRSWQGNERPLPKCWRCGRPGHLKRDCPEPPKEDERTQNRNRQENCQQPSLQAEGRQ